MTLMDPVPPRAPWMLPDAPTPGEGRHLPPRAALDTDAPRLDLSGTWSFRLHASAHPEGLDDAGAPIEPGFDTTDASLGEWGDIDLPAHWVLTGEGSRGLPWYTNVQLAIPLDPPRVPVANPTADHVRTVELPAAWPVAEDGGLDVLRLEGVESFASVWVNGTWVGSTQGSRLATELDVTGLLVAGENTIALRVSQWSPGTYVEDQDQWWLPGVFREVVLLHRPAARIDDVFARTDYEPSTGAGALEVDLAGPEAAFPVEVVVPELGLTATAAAAGTVRLSAGSVEPWSAEVPRLYALEVRAQGETARLRIGFRRLEVVDGQVRVNGRRLVLAGVNRHEVGATRGRVFDEQWSRADLALMKAHNVNAIRTSHYPPHPLLLDLADEIGLWVMEECDLETHAFEAVGWDRNPADDPAWEPVLVDRARRMVERDKNHPSILFWSLGNESGTGRCLAAMSQWIHGRDPSRPVHYESDFAARYTDLASRMYPTLEEVEAAVGASSRNAVGEPASTPIAYHGHTASLTSPAEAARSRTLPYVMCEYLHAMGTGPGGIEDYTAQVVPNPRHLGGFVWEWRDHALVDPRPEAGGALRYGGDFGESVHDGSFVCDGLVSADSSPSAGTTAWANAVAPVIATALVDRPGSVEVVNRFHTRGTESLTLAAQVLVEDSGDAVLVAEVPLPAIAAGESDVVEVPGLAEALEAAAGAAGAEPVHVLTAVLDRVVPALPDDGPRQIDPATGAPLLPQVGRADDRGRRVMSTRETDLPAAAAASARRGAPSRAAVLASPRPAGAVPLSGRADSRTEVGGAVVDGTGRIVALGELEITGPEVTAWRAPTGNDEGHGPLDYWETAPSAAGMGAGAGTGGPSSADRWRQARLDLLAEERLGALRLPDGSVRVTSRASAPSRAWALEIDTLLVPEGDGVRLRTTINPSGPLPPVLPRLGLRIGLPRELVEVAWSGTGPAPVYADLAGAARHGVFSGTVEGLWQQPVRPQEGGTRADLRSLWLTGGESRLMVLISPATPVSFSLSPWSLETLTRAEHVEELVPDSRLWLHLDALHHGIGSRSCGPDVRPGAAASPRPVVIEAWIGARAR